MGLTTVARVLIAAPIQGADIDLIPRLTQAVGLGWIIPLGLMMLAVFLLVQRKIAVIPPPPSFPPLHQLPDPACVPTGVSYKPSASW